MLQKLRDKTSGWIATVILGLLIIPFAFFGMESYMSQQVDSYAARIAQPPSWWTSAPQTWPLSTLWTTHEIDSAEFRQRFEIARMRARDEQGDTFDAKAFESVENKRKILDQMIDEQVMRLAAERDRIVVSDAEVRAAIQDVPDFQVDGKFNTDRYQLLLASQSPPLTPREFEDNIRENLQFGMIPSRLAQSAFATDRELDRLLRLLGEQRDVSFVAMPAVAADTAPVTAAQIGAWYKANASSYRRPETVRLEYVEVDGSKLPVPVVDEALLRKRYQEQSAKYSSAEQRSIAHILVQVAADASDADKKAAEALLADDFVGTTQRGEIENKTQYLASVMPNSDMVKADDYKITIHGDIAIMTHRSTVEGVRNIQFRSTHVWMKRKGKWQIVAHHGSQVTPEQFSVDVSIQALAMVIVGGLGSIIGSYFGAAFILLMPGAMNAFISWLTASARSRRPIPFSGGVAFTRRRRSSSTARPDRFASACAISITCS